MDSTSIDHEGLDLVAETTRIKNQLQTLVNLWRSEKARTDRAAVGSSNILKIHLLDAVIPSLVVGMEGIVGQIEEFQAKWTQPPPPPHLEQQAALQRLQQDRAELKAQKEDFKKEKSELRAELTSKREQLKVEKSAFRKEQSELRAELKSEKDDLKAEKAEFKKERDLLVQTLQARARDHDRSRTPPRTEPSHFYFPGQSRANTSGPEGGLAIFSRKHDLQPSTGGRERKRAKLRRELPPMPEPPDTAGSAGGGREPSGIGQKPGLL